MDLQALEPLIGLAVFLVLLLLGFVIGRGTERRHLRRLAEQEASLRYILVSDIQSLPANWVPTRAFLVTGSVVIANDYFKTFMASLRNLFGGRVRSFETLVERGRREALVRMLEEARAGAANAVWNVRVETSTIHGKHQQRAGGIELIAYGTALQVPAPPES